MAASTGSSPPVSALSPSAPPALPPPSPSAPPAAAGTGGELMRALAESRPRLRRLLRHHAIPAQDAEDLLQETLLLAVASWPEIRSPGPWLYGTLRHRCALYWLRRHNGAIQLPPGRDLTDEIDRRAGRRAPGQEVREQRLLLAELARRLPWRYRRLLVLRFQLGLSPAEVAVATGYAPNSVRKLVQRAVALLRQAAW